MTTNTSAFSQSVQVRRISYGVLSQPMASVGGDDTSDGIEEIVLDPVMKYNPFWEIVDYLWDKELDCQVYSHVET